MESQYERTERLIGNLAMENLRSANVILFGVGGVGSFTAEALIRSGLYNITLVDYNNISITNLNRQIHALHSTIGYSKVEVMKERLLDIQPKASISARQERLHSENVDLFHLEDYDYVIDAIDTISGKLAVITKTVNLHIPIISCMGAGNKMDPTRFQVSDIYQTSICPLAKVMRRELKKRGVEKLKVVWSDEKPYPASTEDPHLRKASPASIGFVPSVAGLIIAGEVIKDIIKWE